MPVLAEEARVTKLQAIVELFLHGLNQHLVEGLGRLEGDSFEFEWSLEVSNKLLALHLHFFFDFGCVWFYYFVQELEGIGIFGLVFLELQFVS